MQVKENLSAAKAKLYSNEFKFDLSESKSLRKLSDSVTGTCFNQDPNIITFDSFFVAGLQNPLFQTTS